MRVLWNMRIKERIKFVIKYINVCSIISEVMKIMTVDEIKGL